jgi:hypothetical protein
VKGITNLIQLKPKAVPHEVKRRIEEALRRSAELDASRITAEAAYAAPGGTRVDNRITVLGE